MHRILAPLQRTTPRTGPLLARLAAALGLLTYGCWLLVAPGYFRNLPVSGGLPLVGPGSLAIAALQCLAGLLLLFGFLSRIGGLLGVATMVPWLYVTLRSAGMSGVPWMPPWPVPLVIVLASLWVLWQGGGAGSMDAALTQPRKEELRLRHHVVIVGGGFGGLTAAQQLAEAPVRVTLVDRRNYHVFQPLLYQVATGELSPSNIASPLRCILERQDNVEVLLGEVVGVDPARRRVLLADGELDYDTLIVAAGAGQQYFGHEEWERLAPGLKSLEDATQIRRRILSAFEEAERLPDPEERALWLTFIIVGGGPTGVELAGAIGEMACYTLRKAFHRVKPTEVRILLLEGSDRILPSFPPALSARAEKMLKHLCVVVRTGVLVTAIRPDSIIARAGSTTEQIPTRTVLWAAGVAASPLGAALARATGASVDHAGRVVVLPNLSVPGHPEIFVIGDLANFSHQTGRPLPGLAQPAMQQGTYVARLIASRLRGRQSARPFRYQDRGTLAVIGRAAAVADLHVVRLSGYPAWLVWLFVHILYIVTFRNRLLVFIQWAWNYLTSDRSSMLITENWPVRGQEVASRQDAQQAAETAAKTDHAADAPAPFR